VRNPTGYTETEAHAQKDTPQPAKHQALRESAQAEAAAVIPEGTRLLLRPDLNLTLPSAAPDRSGEELPLNGAVTWGEFEQALRTAESLAEKSPDTPTERASVFPPSYYLQPSLSSQVPISRILSLHQYPSAPNVSFPGEVPEPTEPVQRAARYRAAGDEDEATDDASSTREPELSAVEESRKNMDDFSASVRKIRIKQNEYRRAADTDRYKEHGGWRVRYWTNGNRSDSER